MTILVTGGAGYIGSQTVKSLLDLGYSVAVLDNLSTGHRQSVDQRAHFYQGDVRDLTSLKAVFIAESIECVIHFASASIVADSMKQPLRYFDDNVYGMLQLLKTMHQFNVTKIVFSSSASVYGQPKTLPVKENAVTSPTNTYGQSKLMMEDMTHWADVGDGIKSIALRYFNVGGASLDGSIGEAHCPETHLIPIVLQVADGKRDELKIYGNDYDTPDGTNVRDYVHVVDLAEAHILAMKQLFKTNRSDVFNIGSSTGFSNLAILKAARKVTGRSINSQFAARRPGDPATLVADSTKARTILGWQPKYDNIEKIIADAWQWTVNHPEGY